MIIDSMLHIIITGHVILKTQNQFKMYNQLLLLRVTDVCVNIQTRLNIMQYTPIVMCWNQIIYEGISCLLRL